MMILLVLFLVPLAGSLMFFVLKNNTSSWLKSLHSVLSGLLLLVTIYIGSMLGSAESLAVSFSWISAFDINFSLGVDGLRYVMILLVAVVSFLLSLSTHSNSEENKNGTYYGLLTLTQAALIGVFLAKDLFLFYFFYELALIPVYFLALYWSKDDAFKATFRMFVYTIFGSLLMLVGFIYLYSMGQTSDMDALINTAILLPENAQRFLFWGLLVAFGIKMPIFPFHSWQPAAYTDSASSGTILLSSLLSKMGVFGLIVILIPFAPLGLAAYADIAIWLSLAGLLYGSFIAIQQQNIKRLVAFSSFAHMGLMAAGILTQNASGMNGALFQMFSHGIAALGLFYVVDIIYRKTGSLNLVDMGGLSQKAPKLVTLFMIVLLGSIALPLTNGFIGEFLLLKGVFDYSMVMGIVAGLTIILGAVYMLRLMQRTMFGTLQVQNQNISDIGLSEMVVLVPVALLTIYFGLFPNGLLEIGESFFDSYLTLGILK